MWLSKKLQSLLLSLICCFPLLSAELFFERIIADQNMPETSIQGITKDSLGYIWFGSFNGLYRFDGKNFEVFKHKEGDPRSIPGNRVRNIITDSNQQIWFLSYDKAYLKFNYSLNRFEIISDSIVPHDIAVRLAYTPSQINRHHTIDSVYYRISYNKLTEVNTITKAERPFRSMPNQPGGLLDEHVTSFFIDDKDIIWIGTKRGELYKADTKRKPFNLRYVFNALRNDLEPTSVRALYRQENLLWIATNHNGMVIYDKKKQVKNHPIVNKFIDELQVRCFYEDANNNLWIGGKQGLGVYNAHTQTYEMVLSQEKYPELRIPAVHSICASHKANQIWVGIYSNLAKIDINTKQLTFYNLRGVVKGQIIMSVLETQTGDLWIATEGAGVISLKFDNTGALTDTVCLTTDHLHPGKRLSNNQVYSVYESETGNIWAGTSEGLNLIEPNSYLVRHFLIENGLADDYISAITGDHTGNIWLSHKKGITKLCPDNYEISNYSINDKAYNWVCLDGACFNDTVSNTIYFGAREGYVSFNPDKIKPTTNPPLVILKNLYVSGIKVIPHEKIKDEVILKKSMALTHHVELNFTHNTFEIELAALYYESPRNTQLLHKLGGFEDDWRNTKLNSVVYSKIPSGDYTFYAKAISPDGIESDTVELTISILPPWYASAWAITGYVLFVATILFFIFKQIASRTKLKNQILLERLNNEKQEELNREKMEFFTNVSHELRTPLTLIVDPIKQLKDIEVGHEGYRLYLDIINRNVEQLSKLINQLLDFRKAEAGKLKARYNIDDGVRILQECVESFYMRARNRRINLTFVSHKDKIIGYYDKQKMTDIFMNLISNALKYTPDGGAVNVEVAHTNETNQISIDITDNGIGIEKQSLKNIFEPFNNIGAKPFAGKSSGMGLALTHNLINLLEGTIVVDSIYKEGTKVKVTLPINRKTDFNGLTGDNLSDENEVDDMAYNTPELHTANKQKPVVLVVEDNADIQTYLKAELESSYMVYQAFNGIEGLNKANGLIPDLIISDIMMPYLDGISMCKEIKQDENTCHVPLIMLTAKTADENRIEGLSIGADAYISKPFNVKVLKANIKSILDNREIVKTKLAKKTYISELHDSNNNQTENSFLMRAINIVKKNMSVTGFTSVVLAEELELSQRQLYRKIDAISGSTVRDFIMRIKMEEAANLLKNSNLNISEVAYRVGYSEPSNFSRTFAKHFGCSPTKYVSNV